MAQEPDGPLSAQRHGAVLELTLCSDGRLNPIDEPLHEALHDAFAGAAREPDVRAVVLASNGKAFSAGGDFDFILHQNLHADPEATVREGLGILWDYLDIPAPVVVALQGDAMGLAASLALAADAVVAHPSVRIADPHVLVGLAAGDGGCLVWPQSAGMMLAKRHLLTGDPVTAEVAARVGLISDLVPSAEDVLPAARELAERLASLPPLAVQGTKRALNSLVRKRYEEVMELSLRIEVATLASADVREAVAAARAKRPGSYQGR